MPMTIGNKYVVSHIGNNKYDVIHMGPYTVSKSLKLEEAIALAKSLNAEQQESKGK